MGCVLELLHYALLHWRLEVLLVLLVLQHPLTQTQSRSDIELLLQLLSLVHHQPIRRWLLGTLPHLRVWLLLTNCLLYNVRLLVGVGRIAYVEVVRVHHQVACGLVIDSRVFTANHLGVVIVGIVEMGKWLVDSDLSLAQDLLPFQVPQCGQLQVHQPEVFLEPFQLRCLTFDCILHPDKLLFTHRLISGDLRPRGRRPRPASLV